MVECELCVAVEALHSVSFAIDAYVRSRRVSEVIKDLHVGATKEIFLEIGGGDNEFHLRRFYLPAVVRRGVVFVAGGE